jgi:uncharacterized protein YidB (DUF937 family)
MFDKILGGLFGKGDADGDGAADGLFAKLGGSLFGEGGLAAGLKGLVDKFSAGGLGEQVKSWVGTGENLPISAEQIGKVFEGGKLQEMAASAGVSVDTIKQKLAAYLPGIVDKLTPNGQMPAE